MLRLDRPGTLPPAKLRTFALLGLVFLLIVYTMPTAKNPLGATVLKNKAGIEVHILSTGAPKLCLQAL